DAQTTRTLRFEVARLAAEFDENLAVRAYCALHLQDPSDRAAWEPLAALYRKQGDTASLAELLGAVAPYVEDVHERARLGLERVQLRVARTEPPPADDGDWETTPGVDMTSPVSELEAIVKLDPSLVEASILLANLLEREGRHDELRKVLEHQLELAKERK